ncbi:unnamed protein product [Miscanthus lutarioriparius]|uniref:Uncharacterized protein n=1 Tax=Miscanthus lutarioriparius TaxID=422564 RepID=A0A811M891_9POAL|nr:unnamed protein product [Miscanthus lutarioriparius]
MPPRRPSRAAQAVAPLLISRPPRRRPRPHRHRSCWPSARRAARRVAAGPSRPQVCAAPWLLAAARTRVRVALVGGFRRWLLQLGHERRVMLLCSHGGVVAGSVRGLRDPSASSRIHRPGSRCSGARRRWPRDGGSGVLVDGSGIPRAGSVRAALHLVVAWEVPAVTQPGLSTTRQGAGSGPPAVGAGALGWIRAVRQLLPVAAASVAEECRPWRAGAAPAAVAPRSWSAATRRRQLLVAVRHGRVGGVGPAEVAGGLARRG